MSDYYELLELKRSANPSQTDITKAYRKVAMKAHPDKGGDPEHFKEVSKAYSVLSDETKRRHYDSAGSRESYESGYNGEATAFDPSSIFEELFRNGPGFPFGFPFGPGGPGGPGGHHGPKQKNHHLHKVQISLKDAYKGVQKQMRITVKQPCHTCVAKCAQCQGQGHINDMIRMGFITQLVTRPCDPCQGKGRVSAPRTDCSWCSGQGNKSKEHTLNLHIPRGVDNGHHIKFEGLGEQPTSSDEIAGDLIFEVIVSTDPQFIRSGADLGYTAKISLAKSIVGDHLIIKGFDEEIHINTAELGPINPTKRYIIKDRGMPSNANGTRFGNLVISFTIEYPDAPLTTVQQSLLMTAFKQSGML